MFYQLMLMIALAALAFIKPFGLLSIVIAFGLVPAIALAWCIGVFIRDTLHNQP